MYAYIKGNLDLKQNDYIVIEAGGIGYKINTSLNSIRNLPAVGEQVKMFTHLYIREDIIALYGFSTMEELNTFELLISVSGVGPKAALSILSSITPSGFGLAVITNNPKALTKAQGIGPKLAQRIILELKDKMKNQELSDYMGQGEVSVPESNNTIHNEAVSALMVLGYCHNDAYRAVSQIYSDGMDLEDTIKLALKSLVR